MKHKDDNVIFLKYKSPHMEPGEMAMLACIVCRNKTYTLTFDQVEGGFPLMRCAACGNHAGRMGWAHDDDDPITDDPSGDAA